MINICVSSHIHSKFYVRECCDGEEDPRRDSDGFTFTFTFTFNCVEV
jgi:hypothetical protein